MEIAIIVACIIAVLAVASSRKAIESWLHKQFGKETVGGRQFAYRDLHGISLSEFEWLLRQSIAENNSTATAWAFEVLLHERGPQVAWPLLFRILDATGEDAAAGVLDTVLPSRSVDEDDPNHPDRWLSIIGADSTWAYLVGKTYLNRGKTLVGVDKEKLKWNKSNALKFLRAAQERALDASAIAVVVPLYEAALYLHYKEGKAAERNE